METTNKMAKQPDLITEADTLLRDPDATSEALADMSRRIDGRLRDEARNPTPAPESGIRATIEAERQAEVDREALSRLAGMLHTASRDAKVREAEDSADQRRDALQSTVDYIHDLERQLADARTDLEGRANAAKGIRQQTGVAVDHETAQAVAGCLRGGDGHSGREKLVGELAGTR